MLSELGKDGKPVYNQAQMGGLTHGVINFNEWFNTVSEVNTFTEFKVYQNELVKVEILYAHYGHNGKGYDCTSEIRNYINTLRGDRAMFNKNKIRELCGNPLSTVSKTFIIQYRYAVGLETETFKDTMEGSFYIRIRQ